MKKISAVVAATLLATIGSAAFAEGFSVSGYLRAGLEGVFDKETVNAESFHSGYYYGVLSNRLRLNFSYDKTNYGATFRFQNDKFSANAEDWFKEGNVKYAQAYAKFLDGAIIAEGGKLVDGYTTSDGYEGFNFSDYDGTYGVRAVVRPIENLFVAVQASSLHLEKYKAGDSKVVNGDAKAGDYILNEKLLSFSAKYSTDSFVLAAGYHLGGEAYAYFGLKAIKNLSADFEFNYKSDDISGAKNKKDEATEQYIFVEDVKYNFAGFDFPLEVGVLAYQTIVTDKNKFDFYPHASYKFNDIVSAQFEAGITVNKAEGVDDTYSLTPSVTFTSGKTDVKVYYTYDKNLKSIIGSSLKVSF